MNAIPKLEPISVYPLERPTYRRWELVRLRERDKWIEANRDLIESWYRAVGTLAEHDDPQVAFAVFADIQFDIERAHLEQLREDAKLDDCYRDSEDA